MTYTIKKSALAGVENFAGMVQAYANDMRVWRSHMDRVAEDERNGVTGIAKHEAYPPPVAHELVAASINDQLDPDFLIEDDGPSPQQILQTKKDDLLKRLAHAEDQAAQSVLPAGKRRLHMKREMAIQDADIANAKSIMQTGSGFLKKFKSPDQAKIAAKIADMRSASDAAFIEERQRIKRKLEAIDAIGAQAASDIEDLTIDNVDGYVIPTFDDAIKGAENA